MGKCIRSLLETNPDVSMEATDSIMSFLGLGMGGHRQNTSFYSSLSSDIYVLITKFITYFNYKLQVLGNIPDLLSEHCNIKKKLLSGQFTMQVASVRVTSVFRGVNNLL